MFKKVKLYRSRIKALRADNGTIEWHTAVAEMRGYNGDTFGARIHATIAAAKRAAAEINGVFNEIGRVVSDLNDALEGVKTNGSAD